MTSTVSKPMLRWSSVRDCARKGVYEAMDAPARDRFPEEDGYLQRGKEIGRGYILRLIATERAAGRTALLWVDSGPSYWCPPEYLATRREYATHLAELRVPWAFGVGHPDLFAVETGTIVEILSAAVTSESYRHSKLLQAVGYAENYERALNVALVVVSPSDYREERTVLVKTSRQYAELVEEMHARVAEVQTWADRGPIPDRVCAKPSEARGHFCQYAAHCFDGWQEPPLEQVAADPALVAAVEAFAAAKKERAALSGSDKHWEQLQKDAQAIIEAADLPVGEMQVGAYKLTRTSVNRKPTFQWEKAESAGIFEPGLYDVDYWKPGASYSTYRTERVDGAIDEDYGDVPF